MVRAGLELLLDALHQIAQPTGTRGSILLMSGGLIVIGFLFLALLFRSAIVGDLAPVANARAPVPRVALPPIGPRRAVATPAHARSFDEGRERGRKVKGPLDVALESLREHGLEVRLLHSGEMVKRVRLYGCGSCGRASSCEFERGLLAGAFETLTKAPTRIHETRCAMSGAQHCEFEVHHAAMEVR